MPPPRIQPQDPSTSPTYAHSTTQPQASIPPSLRRNLFAGHLSRRPVAPLTHSTSGPPSPTPQHSQPDLYSRPTLQPTKRSVGFQDIYDPNVSPSAHPISPGTSTTIFPRESIIAVHPVTGRPLLPNLPTLPARLRLTDGDEEDEDSDMEQDPHLDFRAHHNFPRSPSHHNNLNLSSDLDFDPDMDGSEPHHSLGLNHFTDLNSEESQRDRQRIERLLADMQAQQRARAATSKLPRRNGDDAATVGRVATGGVGASMDPHEKDELMGLIMTSLRRKLQVAEEEGWMFGDEDVVGIEAV